MEKTPKTLENEPSSIPPQTTSSSNGVHLPSPATTPKQQPFNGVPLPSPATTPKQHPLSRSESNGYPTTFIQADTYSFKQVVQMLTGAPETNTRYASKNLDPRNPNKPTAPKKPSFKLYERRQNLRKLKITTLVPGQNASGFSPTVPEILSPSMLDLPSLVLSPVTPLTSDSAFDRPSSNDSNISEEDKAIAEKGFYLHPSPINTPRDSEPPRLLPLFPVTSPRVSSS